MAYTYIRSEPGLYTVGFYNPSGKWEPESDHNDKEEAAKRAAWLNGSPNPYEVDFSRENKELREALQKCVAYLADLNGSQWIKADGIGETEMIRRAIELQITSYNTLNRK